MPSTAAALQNHQPVAAPLFSPEQANRALPYVRRVVEDVQQTYAQITELRRLLEDGAESTSQMRRAEDQYEQQLDRLGELMDELQLVGVELKDFQRGQVDFPCEIAGGRVLLCWMHGEPSVTHWHHTDEGFASRRSLAVRPGQSES